MADRKDFHKKLEQAFGCKCYFQPPETLKLTYPCVVYAFERFDTRRANNLNYIINERYKISFLHKDADNGTVKQVMRKFEKIAHVQHYITNGVYNDVYFIYP